MIYIGDLPVDLRPGEMVYIPAKATQSIRNTGGMNLTFEGAKEFMEAHGVEVIDLDLSECREMMEEFIGKYPEIWNEDIGE